MLFNDIKRYLKILEETKKEIKEDIISSDSPDKEGMIISRPHLYHYAPNNLIPLIKQHGILCPKRLTTEIPEMKRHLCRKYKNFVMNKLKVPEEKIIPENIMDYLEMIHPGRLSSVFTFFDRIPEGIPHLKEFLNTHTPIRIILKKILDGPGSEDFKVYGVNFPYRQKWIKLDDEKVSKISDKDFYGYFAKEDPEKLFNHVPCAAIVTRQGMVPGYAFKILDDSFGKEDEED